MAVTNDNAPSYIDAGDRRPAGAARRISENLRHTAEMARQLHLFSADVEAAVKAAAKPK